MSEVTPSQPIPVVLVHINFHRLDYDDELDEFIQLVESCGLAPVAVIGGQRDRPDPRHYIGSGKVEEVREALLNHASELVIFNHELSPAQERNLEKTLRCRVLDRVGLILDIFAQRARSHEGKLQVELAQLQHLSTRLVRGWTHLERQKGGIGLRGPGETQLETDRRLIGKRIKTIQSRLEKVRRQRQQGRKWRERSGVPVISLVGYTNAGKSTLFNRLSGASAYTADQLFATLDPTLRQVEVSPGVKIILSDTVGFIRDIPHDLIQAFQATLEEVKSADLLLHVVDVTDEQREEHIGQVNAVIHQIGAERVPQIMVYNKIDSSPQVSAHSRDVPGEIPKVWVSARSGEGIDELMALIGAHLRPVREAHRVHLGPEAGRLRASLFASGAVRSEQQDGEGGWYMDIQIDELALEKMCRESAGALSVLQ